VCEQHAKALIIWLMVVFGKTLIMY